MRWDLIGFIVPNLGYKYKMYLELYSWTQPVVTHFPVYAPCWPAHWWRCPGWTGSCWWLSSLWSAPLETDSSAFAHCQPSPPSTRWLWNHEQTASFMYTHIHTHRDIYKYTHIHTYILTLALDIPASIHSLNIQLEDWMGARGAVILGGLSCGAILIGQSDEAENLTGGRIIFNVVLCIYGELCLCVLISVLLFTDLKLTH